MAAILGSFTAIPERNVEYLQTPSMYYPQVNKKPNLEWFSPLRTTQKTSRIFPLSPGFLGTLACMVQFVGTIQSGKASVFVDESIVCQHGGGEQNPHKDVEA